MTKPGAAWAPGLIAVSDLPLDRQAYVVGDAPQRQAPRHGDGVRDGPNVGQFPVPRTGEAPWTAAPGVPVAARDGGHSNDLPGMTRPRPYTVDQRSGHPGVVLANRVRT